MVTMYMDGLQLVCRWEDIKRVVKISNKSKLFLSILQIIVGVLAAVVFVKSIINGGSIEMIIISFMAMILGIANGVKNLRDKNREW